MFKKTLALGAVSVSALVSFPQLALSQSEGSDKPYDEDVDVIVVEATRLNQTASEIGSSVSVITSDDIELLGFDFALDAIASAPGVTINQNGSFGGSASVRIRGASSEQTLVLIDGVQVNDPTSPGGGFNFARLDTEQIERIEVLKGPQSTLWGTDAIGGVVSIITKKPDQGIGGTAFSEYGSFNTYRGGASVGGANDIGDFRLAASGLITDGISKADEDNGNPEEDAFDSVTLSAKGGLNIGFARLDGNILWTDASSEFDSFSGGAQGSVTDGDEVSETEELNANITLKIPLFGDRLENQLFWGYSDIMRENFTNGLPSFDAEGDRMVFRYQGTLEIDQRNTLALGAEHEDTTSRDEDNSISSFFGLYEVKPVDMLTLTGGVRVDDHSTFGTETTGRVAAALMPTDFLGLRASWGQGFKAPTIFQLTFFSTFSGATAPNVDLQPETSEAFDVGVDLYTPDGRASLGMTYFNQETENQIDFISALGTYQNILFVESQGIEVSASFAATDWLTITADYAFIESKDGDGVKLDRVPKHSGDVRFAIDPVGPWSGAVLVRHNGNEQDRGVNKVDDWTRVDVNARYQFNETVAVFGRIENLFDANYQQILGYGTPRLSGSAGVRLNY